MSEGFHESTYRRIVESAPNAIVVVDAEGRILLINAQTEKLFGYPREELIGQSVEVLVPERFRAAHPQHRRDFHAAPGARPMGAGRDLFGRRRDGTEFPVEIGLNPIETEGGRLVLSAIVDITERRKMEAAVREAAADLARSNQDLEQFAYVASHDLREPLRMISSFLRLLEERHRGKLDEDADRFIHYAVDGAVRMHVMIEDLLSFSRAGRADTRLAAVDCGEALAAALENLQAAIAASGARIAHDALPRVEGNAAQLAAVFQNLIENAIKYHGDTPPRIQVSARREGGGWRISVEDDGIGIAPRFAERIFGVFQRLHDHSRYPGTGIGLAVVKRIVERHGGKVWVESTPGAGATFHFTLRAAAE